MKRFTETSKWEDVWYRKLSPSAKLLWHWLHDKCDAAGVIEPDWDLASFQIGLKVSDVTLNEFQGRVESINGKLWIVNFVADQYGVLSIDCRPHKNVLNLIERHGLDLERVTKGFVKSINTLQEQDKEKDKDKDKEQDKEIAKPSKNLSRATRDEIDQFCRDNGLTPRDAEALWSKWEGNGWMNGKQKIKNWQMTIRSWKAQGYMPSQKNPQPGDLWPLDEPEGEQAYEPTPWERIQAKIKAAENAEPAPSEEPTDIEPLAEGELF